MITKRLIHCLLVSLLALSTSLPAGAAMLGTAQIQAGAVPTGLAEVAEQRDWIRTQLIAGGVDASLAGERVAAMTDAQVAAIHQRLDESPAGGNSGLAIGNAIGSNITNIALILGVTALVMPLNVHSRILKKELPLLLGAMLLMLVLFVDDHLSQTDGILLFTALALVMWWIIRQALNDKNDALEQEYQQELATDLTLNQAFFWLILGLLVLLGSSRMLVWGAVNVAEALGVSDLIIGLTIIAIGTSLPELAASITATLKNQHDIAIGNVVGSNTFNTLAVMGIPGLIYPSTLDAGVLERDIPVVLVLNIALIMMVYGCREHGLINRVEGAVLLVCFVSYQVSLYFTELQPH